MRHLSFLFLPLFLISCSSAPKRAMQVSDVSAKADERYETAVSELSSGQFEKAYSHLTQAFNYAVSVDASDLLCKICLSGVVYKIDVDVLGEIKAPPEKSFLNSSAEKILSDALVFARRSSDPEVLSSVQKIYEIKLALAKKETRYDEYLSVLDSVEKSISKEIYYTGYVYRTKGDIFVLKGNYKDAEENYLKAANLHTKNRYLSEIGMDWYSVARSRSLSGQKDAALEAVKLALKYDRDAENTPAIALDYMAASRILLKGNPSAKDKEEAFSLALWAAEIYEAGGFTAEAAECRSFAERIK
ncbi:MAG: hypothetical protein J5780_04670 [Treponema sp.]|nr:hypothetical protein [Treponema sp.]